jgi:hypothetical protein
MMPVKSAKERQRLWRERCREGVMMAVVPVDPEFAQKLVDMHFLDRDLTDNREALNAAVKAFHNAVKVGRVSV